MENNEIEALLDWIGDILYCPSLEAKLRPAPKIPSLKILGATTAAPRRDFSPLLPARPPQLAITQKRTKFPKTASLKSPAGRGSALHFFANHELLAIEMFASAIGRFLSHPNCPPHFISSSIASLVEEQTHLKLYIERMNQLGVGFGDFPLNGFFWSSMAKLNSPGEFLAVMSLTFESANLDFAQHYQNLFHKLGDDQSAAVMKKVLEDEILHVARGYKILKSCAPGEEEFFPHYQKLLPFPLTPARSKGIGLNYEARIKAGLSRQFIESVQNYRDDFAITNRRQRD